MDDAPNVSELSPEKANKKISRWLAWMRLVRPKEAVGMGIIIASRNPLHGRLQGNPRAFEHPTMAAAIEEAKRLSALEPGKTFEILSTACLVKDGEVQERVYHG